MAQSLELSVLHRKLVKLKKESYFQSKFFVMTDHQKKVFGSLETYFWTKFTWWQKKTTNFCAGFGFDFFLNRISAEPINLRKLTFGKLAYIYWKEAMFYSSKPLLCFIITLLQNIYWEWRTCFNFLKFCFWLATLWKKINIYFCRLSKLLEQNSTVHCLCCLLKHGYFVTMRYCIKTDFFSF